MAQTKAYWEARQQALMAGLDKRDQAFSDQLTKEYKRMANDLDKEIAQYYERYGISEVAKYRNMMIGLSDDERNILFQRFDKLAKDDPALAEMLPIRDSIYNLNRLEGLQMSIRMHMVELGGMEESRMHDYLAASYDYGYRGTMSHLPNVDAMFHTNSRITEAMLNDKWFNDKNYSDRIWDNKDTLRNWLTNDLRDGLIRGDNYDKLSKQLAKRMDTGAFYAKRLVWTESSFFMNQGNKNAFVDDGLKQYEYSAIMDNRTTPMCRDLNGRIFEFKDYTPGLNAPPMHSFCRSMVVPIEQELKMKDPTANGLTQDDYSESGLRSVGEQYYDRFFTDEYGQLTQQVNDLQSDWIERVRAWNANEVPRTQANYLALKEAEKQYQVTQRTMYNRIADSAGESLSQIRPVGNTTAGIQPFTKGSSVPIKEAVNAALNHYPSDWTELSKQSVMTTKKVSRGYYGSGVLAADVNESGADIATVYHELGHRMEELNPKIKQAEYEFYQRRTKGEDLKWLGKGYDQKETTRKDNFINRYMGKDYGNKPDSFYELVSMGFEGLFTGKYDLTKDRDYATFILGVLSKL